MAGPLAAMERFFERLFERPAARLLAPRLEPVHLQHHLQRAMESGRVRQGGKWHVQSRFRLLLNPADLVALSGNDVLPAELAEMLRDHARRRGYVLDARPSVRLESSPRVSAGNVVVMTDDLPSLGDAQVVSQATVPAADAAPDSRVAGDAQPRQPATDGLDRGDPPPGSTSVFRATQPTAPRARIAIRAPGQPVTHVAVDGATLRVGRASDNDIVLPDNRVSRYHGQISARLGTLIYADLGSTNGSFLQGSRVQEIALGPHDVLQLGGSSLTIEPAAD